MYRKYASEEKLDADGENGLSLTGAAETKQIAKWMN